MKEIFDYETRDKAIATESAQSFADANMRSTEMGYKDREDGEIVGTVTRHPKHKVLDNGYVRLVESYGRGDANVPEAGIIEAAKQSTQGNFRGWNIWHCNDCGQNFDKKAAHPDLSASALCQTRKGWSNDKKLLGYMFNNNHATPFEFCGMTIEIQAPIFVFREWHRHRTQSYNEMSARYAPLPDLSYLPAFERLFLTQEKNKQSQTLDGAVLTDDNAENWRGLVEDFYARAERLYQYGLDNGIPKELARIVLPVGRYSRMRASANLRNWLGFLALRAHPDAQWEIRQFADAVAKIIEAEFPRTYALFAAKQEGK